MYFVRILFLVFTVLDVSYAIHKRSAKPSSCLDRYEAIPDHTMCLNNIKNRPVKEADRSVIERVHNQIRGNVTPAAADMLEMRYDQPLELEAQLWAEECKLDHDGNYQRFMPGRFMVGQNLVTSPNQMSWEAVIMLWSSEVINFTYNSTANQLHKVGHYTQVVWAKTALVGCGMAECGTKWYYACNYGPAGNIGSLARPYKKATSGGSCDDCAGHCNGTSRLCACGGKVCLNDGVLNLATCGCQCIQDVDHYDSDKCDLTCEDDGDSPLCGNYPFVKDQCATNAKALYFCPNMCNICPYAGANYTEGSVALPTVGSSSTMLLIDSYLMFTMLLIMSGVY
ncbi:cysteine-rich venom protein pseudechetoxin-like [Mya arenaria]|uniref:cysteine-rich venom protein pseudechetoxin-like n=1 Tax=Mya arenaria TaxID=6604 RepID=UPI0022E1AFD2|nr:cysteine-rich venom protein pseudechetoxin-like [Mya arenaria]